MPCLRLRLRSAGDCCTIGPLSHVMTNHLCSCADQCLGIPSTGVHIAGIHRLATVPSLTESTHASASQMQLQCLGCCSAVPQHLVNLKNAPKLGEAGQTALAWGGPLFLAFLIWIFAQLKAYLQVSPSWGCRSVNIEGSNSQIISWG